MIHLKKSPASQRQTKLGLRGVQRDRERMAHRDAQLISLIKEHIRNASYTK